MLWGTQSKTQNVIIIKKNKGTWIKKNKHKTQLQNSLSDTILNWKKLLKCKLCKYFFQINDKKHWIHNSFLFVEVSFCFFYLQMLEKVKTKPFSYPKWHCNSQIKTICGEPWLPYALKGFGIKRIKKNYKYNNYYGIELEKKKRNWKNKNWQILSKELNIWNLSVVKYISKQELFKTKLFIT